MTVTIEAAGRTDVGLVRQRNEDAFYVGRNLFVVADGLGGHPAGDIASTAAVDAVKAADREVEPDQLGALLGTAVSAANEAIRQRIRNEPHLANMATTMVALLHSGASAVLANVGDSRIYLCRSGVTTQVSEDHTYAHLVGDAELVPNLPERLARFLDGRPDGRSADLTHQQLKVGDRLLLCSDGLSSYVPINLVEDALTGGGSPDSVAERLVSLALEHGGPDNVTVVVADVR